MDQQQYTTLVDVLKQVPDPRKRKGRAAADTDGPIGAALRRQVDGRSARSSQATALNDFFKRQGVNRFVDRAIALAESQPFDHFTASEIPVWLPFEIERRAATLATRYPPTADDLAQINALLNKRASEQRAAEAGPARQRCQSPGACINSSPAILALPQLS